MVTILLETDIPNDLTEVTPERCLFNSKVRDGSKVPMRKYDCALIVYSVRLRSRLV
jgi:hypothetical protein